MQSAPGWFMSAAIPSYEGTQQQSDTPLPTVAARAARQAIAAGRPMTITVAQTLARWTLIATIMVGLAALFQTLIAHTLH